MDTATLKKQLQGHTFRENNGRIMRNINILRPEEQTLGNIQFLMEDTAPEALQNSLDYLIDVGYIRVVAPKGQSFTDRINDDSRRFKVRLTASGMEVLMGIKDTPAVEV